MHAWLGNLRWGGGDRVDLNLADFVSPLPKLNV